MNDRVREISDEIVFEGLHIYVYRDPDDRRLNVCVYSDNVAKEDTMGDAEIPRLRLIINECREILGPDDKWLPDRKYGPLDLLAEQAE